MIPVVVSGILALALVNLGFGQMLVHQQLAPPADPSLEAIHLQCVHCDGKPYLSARVPLTVSRVIQSMMIGLAPRLTYSVILGRGWLDFPEVLCTANLGTPPHVRI